MWTPARRLLPIATVISAALTACTQEPQAPTARLPVFAHAGLHLISGDLLGPSGSSLCGNLPPASTVLVRVFDPVSATLGMPFAGAQNVTCPDDAFAILVDPGAYRIRVQLPSTPAIGNLPWRYLEPATVDNSGGDVTQDVQVMDGIAMGGGATLDGEPVEGLDLTLAYDEAPLFGGAFGVTGPDGAWDDAIPERSPMTVQGGVRYRFQANCPLLGARALASSTPGGAYLFPDELSGFICDAETGPATAFSHDRTRLVVTPLPGDIGGQSGELFDQFGSGWGVQFPVIPPAAPVHTPFSATHIFVGGLVVGLAPDVVLTGFNFGFGECGAACRDFGQDGTLKTHSLPSGGKKVMWKYSDAQSPEGVGLQVVQNSFDGKPPNDYVLFQFTFTNTSNATRTFYAGHFGDWDLDDIGGATDDIGFTDLNGRLMYVTNDGETGVHIGTLLLGNYPVAGTNFRTSPPGLGLTLADQFAAISGAVTNPTSGPQDVWYFHTVGPITLKRKKSADVWIAIVAGDDRAQLLANAAAAEADVRDRGGIRGSTSSGASAQATPDPGAEVQVRPELWRPFSRVGKVDKPFSRSAP